jgi:hypothetical protein
MAKRTTKKPTTKNTTTTPKRSASLPPIQTSEDRADSDALGAGQWAKMAAFTIKPKKAGE